MLGAASCDKLALTSGSKIEMTTLRTLAGALLIGLIPLSMGCSSDKKTANRWAGKTYLLDIPKDNWKRPRGSVGSEVGMYVPKFLLDVQDAANGVTVTVGASDASGKQDMCSPTVVIPASAPEVAIGPVDTKLHVANSVGGAAVPQLFGLTFTNILTDTPDAALVAGQFAAVLDAREVYALFNQLNEPSAADLCTFLDDKFSNPCIACPHDSASTTCLELKAVSLAALPITGVVVQAVSDTNLSADCVSAGTTDGGT